MSHNTVQATECAVQSRLRLVRSVILALCFIVYLLFKPSITAAQVVDSRWSEPFQLSTVHAAASEATMVADPYGHVHAFWIESDLETNDAVIIYARFDGQQWTTPYDIYLAPPGLSLGFLSAAVDTQQLIHLVWTEGNSGPIYYSFAAAHDTLSVRLWSPHVRLDIPAYRIRLQVDSSGTLHLLYSQFYSQLPGIYYRRSDDQGFTWSNEQWLDPDIPGNQKPNVIQFAVGESDSLHALWYYVDPTVAAGPGTWIRYARSVDGGDSWSVPTTIAQADENLEGIKLPYPGLGVHGNDVYIVWAGGPAGAQRNYAYSPDGGSTWSTHNLIFGQLLSQALGDGYAFDSEGRLQFLAQLRYPSGIYHAVLKGNVWTSPELVYLIQQDSNDPMGERIHVHNLRLAMREGNQLVVTFTNSPGDAEPLTLYSMHRTLEELPLLPMVETPTPTEELDWLRSNQSSTPESAAPASVQVSETDSSVSQVGLSRQDMQSPTVYQWFSIVPVLILISTVLLVRIGRR